MTGKANKIFIIHNNVPIWTELEHEKIWMNCREHGKKAKIIRVISLLTWLIYKYNPCPTIKFPYGLFPPSAIQGLLPCRFCKWILRLFVPAIPSQPSSGLSKPRLPRSRKTVTFPMHCFVFSPFVVLFHWSLFKSLLWCFDCKISLGTPVCSWCRHSSFKNTPPPFRNGKSVIPNNYRKFSNLCKK